MLILTRRAVKILLIKIAKSLKLEHFFSPDGWHSCPKALEGCYDEDKDAGCNCGADAWNERLFRFIDGIRGLND